MTRGLTAPRALAGKQVENTAISRPSADLGLAGDKPAVRTVMAPASFYTPAEVPTKPVDYTAVVGTSSKTPAVTQ